MEDGFSSIFHFIVRFYSSMLYSNGAVMPSYDVRLSVCLSGCDVGER